MMSFLRDFQYIAQVRYSGAAAKVAFSREIIFSYTEVLFTKV